MRLTKQDGDKVWFAHGRPRGFLCPRDFCDNAYDCDKVKDRTCPYLRLLDKLAAYEDTGLEPDEIKENIGLMSPICVGCDGKTADGKRTEKCTYDEDFRKCLERSVHLSELANAEEQGRLVILPCKVGDTVWSRDVEPWTVVSVEWFSRKVTRLHCKSPVTGRGMTFSVGKRSLGKTVFLTCEEAEAALKGEQGDAG